MSTSHPGSRSSTSLPYHEPDLCDPADLSAGSQSLEPPNGFAEDEIWRSFQLPLVAYARRRLGQTLASKLDPEEIAQSVFAKFFERVRQGRFVLSDRESTWHLLERLANRHCHHCWKYYHAARRDIGREVESTWPAHAAQPQRDFAASGSQPTDQLLLAEALRRVLVQFTNRRHKFIIRLAIRGWKSREISLRSHHSRRGVQQVLQRVRRLLVRMDREFE